MLPVDGGVTGGVGVGVGVTTVASLWMSVASAVKTPAYLGNAEDAGASMVEGLGIIVVSIGGCWVEL
jgi:hypothetical protein